MLQPNIPLGKIFPGQNYHSGSRLPIDKETTIDEIKFKIYKCNNRPKLQRKDTIIIPCLGEFGCITIASIMCIPKLLQNYSGKFSIIVTWPGLEYLFRHLCDKIFIIDSPNIGEMKDFCRAFHNSSKNLSRCEELLSYYGNVISAHEIGRIALKDIFPDTFESKKHAVWLPPPSQDKMDAVKKYIKPNTVLVNARGRKCYGRNLSTEFYSSLIDMLKDTGHHVLWVGDETVQSVVRDDIIDYSKTEEAKDIECTFALTSMSKVSIQFYTASSRLAAMSHLPIPHIIFETDHQIFEAQEGYRMFLADRFDKKKLVISHFWDTYNNIDKAVNLVHEAIKDIENNDFSTKIGLVDNPGYIQFLINGEKRFKI